MTILTNKLIDKFFILDNVEKKQIIKKDNQVGYEKIIKDKTYFFPLEEIEINKDFFGRVFWQSLFIPVVISVFYFIVGTKLLFAGDFAYPSLMVFTFFWILPFIVDIFGSFFVKIKKIYLIKYFFLILSIISIIYLFFFLKLQIQNLLFSLFLFLFYYPIFDEYFMPIAKIFKNLHIYRLKNNFLEFQWNNNSYYFLSDEKITNYKE